MMSTSPLIDFNRYKRFFTAMFVCPMVAIGCYEGRNRSAGLDDFEQCVGAQIDCNRKVNVETIDVPEFKSCEGDITGTLEVDFIIDTVKDLCQEKSAEIDCSCKPSRFSVSPDGSVWALVVLTNAVWTGSLPERLDDRTLLVHYASDGTKISVDELYQVSYSIASQPDTNEYVVYATNIAADERGYAYAAIFEQVFMPKQQTLESLSERSWIAQYDKTGGLMNLEFECEGIRNPVIAVGPDDRVSVTGAASHGEEQRVVAQLDANGKTIWRRTDTVATETQHSSRRIATDSNGNVTLISRRNSNSVRVDFTRFDEFGNLVWVREAELWHYDDIGKSLTTDSELVVDSAGNTTVSSFQAEAAGADLSELGPAGFDRADLDQTLRILHLDSNGDARWAYRIPNDAYHRAIAVDSENGSVYFSMGSSYEDEGYAYSTVGVISENGNSCVKYRHSENLYLGRFAVHTTGAIYFVDLLFGIIGRFRPIDSD